MSSDEGTNTILSGITDPAIMEFANSLSFDRRLLAYDIEGSKAHVMMLMKEGHIKTKDGTEILKALNDIEEKGNNGGIELKPELEDIHMNVEAVLVESIGEKGGNVHLGRSRNDQVALDLRLYTSEEITEIIVSIKQLQRTILGFAEGNLGVIIPGYTHLQQAQPILMSHHMMAHVHRLQRDVERFNDCLPRVRVNPLGSAALGGTSIALDRVHTTETLGFDVPCENSLDGVSDRDFALETAFCASVCMAHLSGLCEELILWSSKEFGFVRFGNEHLLGSSIMPQKMNPDIMELVRGKTGRVNGNLVALLTVMKGLPLAYNKDLQEDKEALFDSVDTLKGSLYALDKTLASMNVTLDQGRILEQLEKNFANSTALADYVSTKMGVPFRKAYGIARDIIAYCAREGKTLGDLTLHEYRQFGDFTGEVYEAVDIEKALEKEGSYGGTTLPRVRTSIEEAKKTIEKNGNQRDW